MSNSGPPIVYGETFKLFNAKNYSGAFSRIIPTVPGPNLLWNTNWISVNGTIFVTSTNLATITPPRITSVSLSDGQLAVAGTNGNAPGTYYDMLSTTNLALPVTHWTIVATNQFGPGGGFTFTNNVSSTVPQQFFMLRLQ